MISDRKIVWPGGTQLAPSPVVLVGCGDGRDFAWNLITVAWTGTLCSEPPMVGIGIRPERYSRGLIESTGEFTVNIPDTSLAKAVDYCGIVSGRDVNKWKESSLTPVSGSKVSAPVVAQCPLTLECKVRHTLELGTHILYVGEILAVQVESRFIDEKGRFDVQRADLLGFAHGHYFSLGKELGSFGFSVRKK